MSGKLIPSSRGWQLGRDRAREMGRAHREIIELHGGVGSSCQETHKICWDVAAYYDKMVVWNVAFMTFHLLGMENHPN